MSHNNVKQQAYYFSFITRGADVIFVVRCRTPDNGNWTNNVWNALIMMHADPQTATILHNCVLGISVLRQVTLLLYTNQIVVIKYIQSHFDLMILNRKKFHSIVTGTPALNAVSSWLQWQYRLNYPCYPYSFHINDWLDSKTVKQTTTDSTQIPPKL